MTRAARSSAFQLLAEFGGRGTAAAADQQDEIRASYDEGYLQGAADARAEAEADCEARLTSAGQDYAERLATERESWQRDVAEVLSAEIATGVAKIQRSIGDRVAALLKPWLTERLYERAMYDFEKAIERALADNSSMEIEGPSDILRSIREKFPVEVLQVAFTESESPSVKAQIDSTRIEIDMSAWLAELEGGGE